MYRIDNSSAAAALPAPSAPGPNPDGFFTDGNPGTGTPATVVDAEWANMVQEEIANVIESVGALDKGDRTQLLDSIVALIAASVVTRSRAVLVHTATAGSHGGSVSAATWGTRPQTEAYDPDGIVSVASNQFTLQAGTYLISAWAVMYCETEAELGTRIRIRNITDGATVAVGSSNSDNSTNSVSFTTTLFLPKTAFTIAGAKVFELQDFANLATATYGRGRASSGSGEAELFAATVIEKVA